MADVSAKVAAVSDMIRAEQYFVINRPRQYGKTTMLDQLYRALQPEFCMLNISFEHLDYSQYHDVASFTAGFLSVLATEFQVSAPEETNCLTVLHDATAAATSMLTLSLLISRLIKACTRPVVLLIDEVDQSTNNQLFLDFLGMLRHKYLQRTVGKDVTFHSVVLAGVHDVKTLKIKLRADQERRLNSPWNIAVNFDIDLAFSPAEIAPMLSDYSHERGITMDIPAIAGQLHFYTSGYPFLVSRLCQIIDKAHTAPNPAWTLAGMDRAVKELLAEKNPNFESLIKNLENNPDLSELVQNISLLGQEKLFNLDNPTIELGVLHGILKNASGKIAIHNQVYTQRIYDYFISKVENSPQSEYTFRGQYLQNGQLNMDHVLARFQQFMKEQYSRRDAAFLEREGRLLLLAFIKPIINGQGFDFKEVQISEEKRLDVVITFGSQKYVLELKRWFAEDSHQRGLTQLADYLTLHGLTEGYLVIFDFRKTKSKRGQRDLQTVAGKRISMVWV